MKGVRVGFCRFGLLGGVLLRGLVVRRMERFVGREMWEFCFLAREG